MLSQKQILEIREHLEKAQNPVFFYDNDADGFCSYVLLRKFVGRGKGVIVRSHPDIDESYAKKAQELNADYVFVLDRPVLGKKFVEEIEKLSIPLVWIDHHDLDEEKINYRDVFVFNPSKNKPKSSEPVSYLCYKIADRSENIWIALMGCIADHYLPDFAEDFGKNWPENWSSKIKEPFDAYYTTEIGKLARIIGFALKDSITHIVQFQNFMITCSSPSEMVEELEGNKPFVKKYKELKKKYDLLINKAKKEDSGKFLFFNYGGDMSISSEISNELSYYYPDKIIVVAYSSGPITNISMRGKAVKKKLLRIINDFENASGGGHDDAIGARIQTSDLQRFKESVQAVI